MSIDGAREHWSTFGGNPLACSVALASLKVMEEDKLAETARVRGEQFRKEMSLLPKKVAKLVRGKGLLNAVVVNEGTCLFLLLSDF